MVQPANVPSHFRAHTPNIYFKPFLWVMVVQYFPNHTSDEKLKTPKDTLLWCLTSVMIRKIILSLYIYKHY